MHTAPHNLRFARPVGAPPLRPTPMEASLDSDLPPGAPPICLELVAAYDTMPSTTLPSNVSATPTRSAPSPSPSISRWRRRRQASGRAATSPRLARRSTRRRARRPTARRGSARRRPAACPARLAPPGWPRRARGSDASLTPCAGARTKRTAGTTEARAWAQRASSARRLDATRAVARTRAPAADFCDVAHACECMQNCVCRTALAISCALAVPR